ncbi:MAG TPA: anhydro-N-acetylmuramic acid kinase, partial [Kribbella sp.]|nr:anhydro-N-acetylmuramic acid kinase [Kribbella sp.]
VVTASPDSDDTFDRNGELGAAGAVLPTLLKELASEPYYALPAPKSTGKELFHLEYVRDALRRTALEPSLPDLVATLTELTAVTVADAIRAADLEVLVVSGGGVHNTTLMRRLGELVPGVRVLTSDQAGVSSDAKEAVAFALIGWATLHGLPGNVPSCTGASGPRVLGRITPAPGRPLPTVEPLSAWPDSLAFAETVR